MSFVPAVPMGGLAGWAFLGRTKAAQQAAFSAQPMVKREVAHFAEKIAQVRTAADLVADRALLKVALGAFGLGDDLGNRHFVRRILEEGTSERSALANKLTDKRYARLAEAFGFDRAEGPRTREPGFAERIVAAHQARGFEEAVGEQHPSLRLALNLDRDLADLAGREMSEAARWFTIMGTPPLRQVFEVAFGLPKAFGTLDVDQQRGILEQKARAAFGSDSVARFKDPQAREALAKRYLARAQIAEIAEIQSPAANALLLLSSLPRPPRLGF